MWGCERVCVLFSLFCIAVTTQTTSLWPLTTRQRALNREREKAALHLISGLHLCQAWDLLQVIPLFLFLIFTSTILDSEHTEHGQTTSCYFYLKWKVWPSFETESIKFHQSQIPQHAPSTLSQWLCSPISAARAHHPVFRHSHLMQAEAWAVHAAVH